MSTKPWPATKGELWLSVLELSPPQHHIMAHERKINPQHKLSEDENNSVVLKYGDVCDGAAHRQQHVRSFRPTIHHHKHTVATTDDARKSSQDTDAKPFNPAQYYWTAATPFLAKQNEQEQLSLQHGTEWKRKALVMFSTGRTGKRTSSATNVTRPLQYCEARKLRREITQRFT